MEHDNGLALMALLTLRECEDYFDSRADADSDSEGTYPNEELRMLTTVRAAISKLERIVACTHPGERYNGYCLTCGGAA